jgi:hypothetical protein
MTLFANYAAWIVGLKDWLSVADYTDNQVAMFLSLAQLRLNRELMSYEMEGAVTPTVSSTPLQIHSSVQDFNKIRLVSYPGVGSLSVMAINEMKTQLEVDPSPGTPSYYCIDAGKLYLYPKPSDYTMVDFLYYKQIPLLSSTRDTNVFSIYHSDLLLFAASLEAAPYMESDDRIPVWQDKYAQALEAYSTVSKKIKMGSTPLKREVLIT